MTGLKSTVKEYILENVPVVTGHSYTTYNFPHNMGRQPDRVEVFLDWSDVGMFTKWPDYHTYGTGTSYGWTVTHAGPPYNYDNTAQILTYRADSSSHDAKIRLYWD